MFVYESSGAVSMRLMGVDAGMIYLAFSVIVKTVHDDDEVKIHTYLMSPPSVISGNRWGETIYAAIDIPDFEEW